MFAELNQLQQLVLRLSETNNMPFFWEYIPPTTSTKLDTTARAYNIQDSIKDRLLINTPVDLTNSAEISRGKRIRSFSSTLARTVDGKLYSKGVFFTALPKLNKSISYSELYNSITKSPKMMELYEFLSCLPLRIVLYNVPEKITEIQLTSNSRDPELHTALQDLAYEINEDIREACFALDDPDLYYPGVDEGIEPVTDDHINLVIWGMQRELNRELRSPLNSYESTRLPAVPLNELPWNIKRALVERRRLRYKEFGITKENWETGIWSLWNVPEDPNFLTRRSARMNNIELT